MSSQKTRIGARVIFSRWLAQDRKQPYTQALGLAICLLIPLGAQAREGSTVTLSPGFQFGSLSGLSGGDSESGGADVNVSSYEGAPTGSCSGVIGSTPNHNMIVRFELSLIISAVSTDGREISLFIQGPQGVHCNDHRVGNMTTVRRTFPPGNYSIFVGSEAPDKHHPYTITFNEVSPEAIASAPPPDPKPTEPSEEPAPTQTNEVTPPEESTPIATAVRDGSALSQGFGSITLTGVSGGAVDGRNFITQAVGDCVGFIGHSPNHIITLTEPLNLSIDVTPMQTSDTTLIIQGPQAAYCNDDFRGLNPGLSQFFPAGTYFIYVGSYLAGQRHAYNMSIREIGVHAAPEQPQPPSQQPRPSAHSGSLSSGFGLHTERGVSGGGMDGRSTIDSLGQPCVGWYSTTPNHTLDIEGPLQLTISLTPDQQADTTIMVRGPDGTFCNDDYEGLNPGINRIFQGGSYQVFVGSYLTGRNYPYTLNVRE